MAMKPVTFEQYMQWFDNHAVVIKGMTVNNIKVETAEAAKKAPLQMAMRPVDDMELTLGTRIPMVQGNIGNDTKVKGSEEAVNLSDTGGDFKPPLKDAVDDQGVVSIKCSRGKIGPVAYLTPDGRRWGVKGKGNGC